MDTPILIKSVPLTLDQWLRELSGNLLRAAKAGKDHVCITTELAVGIANQASEYAEVLSARRAKQNGD